MPLERLTNPQKPFDEKALLYLAEALCWLLPDGTTTLSFVNKINCYTCLPWTEKGRARHQQALDGGQHKQQIGLHLGPGLPGRLVLKG